MELNENTIKALTDIGMAQCNPRTVEDGAPYIVVPDGYKVENLESLMELPLRKRGAIVTTNSVGFVDYLQKHSAASASTIYADIDSEQSRCKLLAVIDDHSSDIPQWREHTCKFEPKLSVEWTRWNINNKKMMDQAAFASFLEDNLPDIASVTGFPTGTEVLQMALGFEANADKKFRSKINLQSGGVQFEYVEDETKDTRTKMIVFERFTIGVPVFDASANAYPVEARLKYREKGGNVMFWYELIRPDRVFKSAVADELSAIIEGTGLKVIAGSPGL
jgi:uncharacterized protein YfdQ (DUF2303 family)